MAAPPTERQHRSKGLSTPVGPTNTLLVVEPHRRHVRQHNSLQVADVNTYLHRSRHAEKVDGINQWNWLASPICSGLDYHVPEASLPVGLIVCLGRQFLTMQPHGRPPLNRLTCIVVSAVKCSALRIWIDAQLGKAPRADTGRTVHVYTLARRTGPERIVLERDSNEQTVSLELSALMPPCLTDGFPCRLKSSGLVKTMQTCTSSYVVTQSSTRRCLHPVYPIIQPIRRWLTFLVITIEVTLNANTAMTEVAEDACC